jgi:hypothetical protein
VIDTLAKDLPEHNTSEKLAYFYCYRAEDLRRDPESILNAVIQQLVQIDDKSVLKLVVNIYTDRKKRGQKASRLTLQESQELLIKITDIYSQTTICLDALDEVDRDSRINLLKSLKLVMDNSKSLVKIFATSRNDLDILHQFSMFPKIDVQPDDHADDIDRFVQSEVKSAIDNAQLLDGIVNNTLQDKICDILRARSKGM